MLKRTLTTLLLVPPVLYLIGWSPKWFFVLAVSAAVVLALREYFALCRATGFKVFSCVGYGAGVALCLLQVAPWPWHIHPVFLLVVALLILIPTLALEPRTDFKDYLGATAVTLFGILFIGISLSCLIPIRFTPHPIGGVQIGGGWVHSLGQPDPVGNDPILLLFLVIWGGDTCAYLVGRPLGRTPFFARISPRKTWEGAVAGLAGSLLAAWGFDRWYWKTGNVKAVILLAAWIGIMGQVGDLVESAIKRGAKQKDSGNLLPGHGGFLDRIDSLLFATPALWLAISLTIGLFRVS